MGLALSVKRGDTPRSEVSADVLKIVDSMSEKDLRKYAGTSHTGLPQKVEAKIREMVRELYKEMKSVSEGVKIKMNNLDWGKSTAERNANLDKYASLKTDKERESFLRKLKRESVNEASRRSTDFYGDSKYGKSLHSLLKGKWDSKKVENYLEKLGGGSDVKYTRLIDFISKDAGLDTRKYKTIGEQLPHLMKQLEVLYKDFLTESVNEEKVVTKQQWDVLLERDSTYVGYVELENGKWKRIIDLKSLQAAKVWMGKNSNKLLNTPNVYRVGYIMKDDWDSSYAIKESTLTEKKKSKVVTKQEWDKKHKDFKGMVDGEPYMMYLDPKTGATVYGPVTIKESK